MDADLIGLFALLIGLELILGVDNVLVIAILVARLPESQRGPARNTGLILTMVMRILMVAGGLQLMLLTDPIWAGAPNWCTWKGVVLMAGGIFLIWKASKEIYMTVELEHEKEAAGVRATLASIVSQIVILDIVFSLDSVITAVGLVKEHEHKELVIISAVIVSFAVIMFFAKPIGDFILAHVSIKILALAFLIVIGVTIFMEGMGKHVDKKLIYMPMGFAMVIQFLQMRHGHNKEKLEPDAEC